MSFSWKNIRKPTPILIRRIANSILAGCGIISGGAYLGGYPVFALVWLHIGALAKMFSTFFADDNDKQI